MCFNYALTKHLDEISKLTGAEWDTAFQPIYHSIGFNFPEMPVITSEKNNEIQHYQWGLIPHWVTSLNDATKMRALTLNAKAETLFEKPSFKPYVQNRCVVLADGFFEWMEFKKKKYPHYVHLKNFDLFGFAGLFAHWVDKESGELLRTFTIITTEANPLMARIHNIKKRMPVILQKDQWQAWLQPALTKEAIQEFLRPCTDNNMAAYPVSKLITTRGATTNVPDIKDPYSYPELLLTE